MRIRRNASLPWLIRTNRCNEAPPNALGEVGLQKNLSEFSILQASCLLLASLIIISANDVAAVRDRLDGNGPLTKRCRNETK